mmetsp:Transcript_39316/g.93137  ORF Transcript_39316/g.93137 Transcript_39316/m.93137 type:complete len:208 (-) Transcript_39316:142-765(-)
MLPGCSTPRRRRGTSAPRPSPRPWSPTGTCCRPGRAQPPSRSPPLATPGRFKPSSSPCCTGAGRAAPLQPLQTPRPQNRGASGQRRSGRRPPSAPPTAGCRRGCSGAPPRPWWRARLGPGPGMQRWSAWMAASSGTSTSLSGASSPVARSGSRATRPLCGSSSTGCCRRSQGRRALLPGTSKVACTRAAEGTAAPVGSPSPPLRGRR